MVPKIVYFYRKFSTSGILTDFFLIEESDLSVLYLIVVLQLVFTLTVDYYSILENDRSLPSQIYFLSVLILTTIPMKQRYVS